MDDRERKKRRNARMDKKRAERIQIIKLRKKRRFKLWLIRFAFLGGIIFLCRQIIVLKVVSGNEYERRAIAQMIGNSISTDGTIIPNRGAIMDRNKKVLAASSTVYNVILDIRNLVKETQTVQEDTVNKLHQVLKHIPLEELWSLLELEDKETLKAKIDKLYYIVEKKIPYDKGKELEALNPKYVYLEDDTKRQYIDGGLASSLIGFIRGDVPWGLERQYNSLLSGEPGRIFRTYDAERNVNTERYEAVEGHTVITTIDSRLQAVAEQISEKYGVLFEAENASMIIMNPYTGEIEAMAQYPTFNLNDPADVNLINDSGLAEIWDNLSQSEQMDMLYGVWANFNISSMLEIGSVFKPITVAAALEEGIIDTDEKFYCGGYATYAGYDISCHKKTGHGLQTLDEALANSCNVAMMLIAEEMGRDIFYKYQRDFGYGEKTGIDLPGEASGVLHSLTQLNASELATNSFGQRFKSTPLQAITSFAAVINGGNLMKPYVVSQVVDEKGRVVFENKPTVSRKVITKETSDYLRYAMEKVISPSGTGRNAAIEGYAIGGKTGTGEQGLKTDEDYVNSLLFCAYLPVENPQYLVLAVIDKVPNEKYENGANSASIMLQEMLLEIIDYKNIQPSYQIMSNGASQTGNTFSVEQYTGQPVDTVIKSINDRGISYEIIGGSGGTVTAQHPQAGSVVPKGTVIFLTISNDDGRELVPVPSVVGLEAGQAESALNEAGFSPVIIYGEYEPNEEQAPEPTYWVYSQTPDAGIKLPTGTQVIIRSKVLN